MNLVEVEFHGRKAVIDAWKLYWAHLQKGTPVNEAQAAQFLRERDALLTKLLHGIAKALNFKMEQLDIFEGGYAPQGWIDDEDNLRLVRTLLLDVLNGRRGIPIVPLSMPVQNSPYPPPPSEALPSVIPNGA